MYDFEWLRSQKFLKTLKKFWKPTYSKPARQSRLVCSYISENVKNYLDRDRNAKLLGINVTTFPTKFNKACDSKCGFQSCSQHRRCCSKGIGDAAPTSNLRRLTQRGNRENEQTCTGLPCLPLCESILVPYVKAPGK